MPRRGPTSLFPSYFPSPTSGFLPNATFSSNPSKHRLGPSLSAPIKPSSGPTCHSSCLPQLLLSHRQLEALSSRQFDRGLDSPCSLRARPTPICTDSVCLYPIAGSVHPIWTAEPGFERTCFFFSSKMSGYNHSHQLDEATSPSRYCFHSFSSWEAVLLYHYLFLFMLLCISCTLFLCQGRCPSFFLSASSSSFTKAMALDIDQYVPGLGHGLDRRYPGYRFQGQLSCPNWRASCIAI